MPKRVAINISLPDQPFKDMVLKIAANREIDPSEEFVALYKRLSRRDLSSHDNA